MKKIIRYFSLLLLFVCIIQTGKSQDFVNYTFSLNAGGSLYMVKKGQTHSKNLFAFNNTMFEAGVRIYENIHELGIAAGNIHLEELITTTAQTPLGPFTYKTYKSVSLYAAGLYYKIHIKNILFTGIKWAFTSDKGDLLEFCVGKDFNINKQFFIRGNAGYSYETSTNSEQVNAYIGIGIIL